MNPVLHTTQFDIDKANKKVHISRIFNAPLDRVWQAWTDHKILDQWWAPKPWKAETKKMDFREGGSWLYCMVGPEGERHWSGADYKQIDKEKGFRAVDFFCDQDGVKNTALPSTEWHTGFTSVNGGTQVDIGLSFQKQEDLEQLLSMGFKEGFSMATENLDQFLASK